MKRFIVLVSRDIPGLYETDGSVTPRLFISFNSISSRVQIPPSKFFCFHFFHVRVDLQKGKQRKKKRERERKRKYIGMSNNNSKQLPVNFRHASRQMQPRSLERFEEVRLPLYEVFQILSLPFAANNETLT